MNPNNIMNNHLHTYFDRTQVGRRDFFRQLIFLTFVPLSILLFSLHLLGSYGLNVQAGFTMFGMLCYWVGCVSCSLSIEGAQKVEVYNARFRNLLNACAGGATIDIGFYGTPRPYAYYAQSYHLLSNCAYK